eukprot:TRINITY_DN26027_c0_g1_i1.p1 TRINITY_DN26027_c0_g1~~TRINITY_DN26027_c0_g1_i1.p1  ORF type:complete len:400 (-),score=105.75 TRINITY_DN26027_c0_g1_i1:73-1272(-)
MDAKEGDEQSSGGKVQSYAHIRGEWEQRKPSLFGAVKSFLGQLQKGQELTKVSLPCVFLRPYSLLEEVAARELSHFDLLITASEIKDPVERFLGVARWLISTARQEEYRHKPFNPVIGEVHRCKYNHDPKDKDNTTYVVMEQVEHHPPTCGIRIDNPGKKIWIEGFITFKAEMFTNSVMITNYGQLKISINDEIYFLPKPMPDLLVKNIIMGTKVVAWEGDIDIVCTKSNLRGLCQLALKSKGNTCEGNIYDNAEKSENSKSEVPLIIVDGKCGGPATWKWNLKHKNFEDIKDKSERKEKEKEKELCDEESTRAVLIPTYPEQQEKNSSITIWEPVRKCIIANDMDQGDIEKSKIENGQRALFLGLKEKGEKWQPVYFKLTDENHWTIIDTNWYREYKD